MSENLQSILIGTLAFSAAIVVAIFLTIVRKSDIADLQARNRLLNLFLLGIAFQCLHFVEEFITRLYERLPQLLGLKVWFAKFFVAFNLFWIFIWILSALGVKRNLRVAFFPVWFFAIGMTANGIVHHTMAIAVGDYFPGLITSPIVGIIGIILLMKILRLTQ